MLDRFLDEPVAVRLVRQRRFRSHLQPKRVRSVLALSVDLKHELVGKKVTQRQLTADNVSLCRTQRGGARVPRAGGLLGPRPTSYNSSYANKDYFIRGIASLCGNLRGEIKRRPEAPQKTSDAKIEPESEARTNETCACCPAVSRCRIANP